MSFRTQYENPNHVVPNAVRKTLTMSFQTQYEKPNHVVPNVVRNLCCDSITLFMRAGMACPQAQLPSPRARSPSSVGATWRRDVLPLR
jgi:hypothetical protein